MSGKTLLSVAMRLTLKMFILQSGRSQRELAAETRIREARLSQIVRGWCTPTPEERARLQRALGVDDRVFDDEIGVLQ